LVELIVTEHFTDKKGLLMCVPSPALEKDIWRGDPTEYQFRPNASRGAGVSIIIRGHSDNVCYPSLIVTDFGCIVGANQTRLAGNIVAEHNNKPGLVFQLHAVMGQPFHNPVWNWGWSSHYLQNEYSRQNNDGFATYTPHNPSRWALSADILSSHYFSLHQGGFQFSMNF
jgi:hypothetical protein